MTGDVIKEVIIVEVVKKIVDSNLLREVISLPDKFLNKEVEVTISLQEEKVSLPPLKSIKDIDELLKGSITETLIGALSPSDITLEEIKLERLKKYENPN